MKKLLVFLAALAINLQVLPAVHALDTRIIDTVSVTWRGAPAPKPSLDDLKKSIVEEVNPRWISLTSFVGGTTEKSIDFQFGTSLTTPLTLTTQLNCNRGDFATLVSSLRQETYSRLGITDYRDRYLAILIPEAGCIWSGKALIGDKGSKGGILMLHNTAESFVIAHELGHTLGLGHSNLMRCEGKSFEGAWGNSCRAVEYGGAVDLMSNVDVKGPLSTYHQWRMGLMENSSIKQSWLSESITLRAVDQSSGIKSVFLKDGKATYWIEYRKAVPSQDYQSGLVIYRTDPPAVADIVSPNPDDRTASEFGTSVGTDMWMLNLDSFTYASSKGIGSMTLPQGRTISLFSGNVSISISAGANEDEVKLAITRKPDVTPPPIPALTASNTWRFQNSPILASNYDDGESAIDYFEIQSAGKTTRVNGSADTTWSPTYLNPLSAPKSLYLKDLPEGSYEFKVRAIDLWGNASPWSDARTTVVDRGHPIVEEKVRVAAVAKESISIEFSGIRDDGSGLCQTRLVNPEGFVKQRSTAKSNPILNFTFNTSESASLETIDCLGNGVRSSFSLANTFESPSATKRTGKWSAASASFGSGALKCSGTCTASISLSGNYSILTGPNPVDVYVSSKLTTKVSAVTTTGIRSATTIDLGPRKKVVRLSGKDFVLTGFVKLDLALNGKTEFDAKAPIIDPTVVDPIQKQMSRYGFNTEDFVPDWVALPMARGTTLEDPTLDLCGGDYKSESGREIRRQISVTKAGSPYVFLSTEVVKYKNVSAASAAVEELLARQAACVTAGGFNENGTFTKYEFKSWSGNTKGLVDEKNRLLVHTKIGTGQSTRTLLGFYQFSGEYYTGLYIVSPKAEWFSDAEIERWSDVARIMATRMNTKAQA